MIEEEFRTITNKREEIELGNMLIKFILQSPLYSFYRESFLSSCSKFQMENMFSQLIKSSFSTLASPRHVSYRSTFSTYSLSGITVPPLSLQLDFLHIASIFLKCDVGCSRSIWNMVFSFFNRCLDVRLLPFMKL
eukprot:GHVP01034041.1.p1 GENE.GHVP01034041.1~~GHVP01034041.1.p1  ORF type:complete len:135 (-),score=9.25 GHVP01034041.1:256-660(-)